MDDSINFLLLLASLVVSIGLCITLYNYLDYKDSRQQNRLRQQRRRDRVLEK